MTKIRAIIVDDEPLSADALIWEISDLKLDIEVAGVANSGSEGIALIEEIQPDLVFLDIEMPLMNGFDMLRNMNKINFAIIFTTAYDQYAINAFEINAFDYLLKPVTKEDLQRVLGRFSEAQTVDQWMSKLDGLHKILKKQNPAFDKIAWPTSEGMEFLSTDQIIRCQSESNYTHIILRDSGRLLVSRTLSIVEEMIDSKSFLRVHKSHLINLKYIRRFVRNDGGYIVMDDGSQVPVSRRKKEDLVQLIK